MRKQVAFAVAAVALVACASENQGESSPSYEAPQVQESALGQPCPATMVELPAGSFATAWGPGGGYAKVGRICVDKTEVTVAAYAKCVAAGRCAKIGTKLPYDNFVWQAPVGGPKGCNEDVPGRGNHAMNCANFKRAMDYCIWAGARLPTQEEWEWAALGGTSAPMRLYPWGNANPYKCQQSAFEYFPNCPDDQRIADTALLNSLMCSNSDMGGVTCPVASHPAGNTPTGISDMLGGVMEWTTSRSRHVFMFARGPSSYEMLPKSILVGVPFEIGADEMSPQVGFRCVRDR